LEEYRNDINAYLEVRCGFGTPNEKIFVIPMPYLLERVIPNADRNERGQYLFTVANATLFSLGIMGSEWKENRFWIIPQR
jgi:hypothetical protein